MVNLHLPETARRIRALATPEQRRWYEFRNAADTDTGPVEILVYDEIDPFWGVAAADFVRDLARIDADRDITVRINSPGGDVYEGIAILNALRGHDSTVTVFVDGIAASIASVIAMSGNEIVMMPNSEMMIHDPWMLAVGNAKDMQDAADNLARIADNIASVYADRVGGTAEEWRAVMQAETWYSADEAVTAGLATRVEKLPAKKEKDEKAKTANRFDLSIFNYAGRAEAPAPVAIATSSAAEAEVAPEGKEGIVPTLNEGLAERLGIAADADDETVLNALDEALAERATPEGGQEQQTPAAPAAQLPDGVVAIDAATLQELQDRARRGDEARTEQERSSRIDAVAEAVATGRIAPAQRDAWVARIEKDPSEAQVLAQLAPVYPVNEIGHGVGTEYASDVDPYEAIYGKDA